MVTFPADTPQDVVRKATDILAVTRSEQLHRGRPLSVREWFGTALKVCNVELPDSPQEVIRSGLSNANTAAAFTGQVNQFFVDSFREVKNTLLDILSYQDIESFIPGIVLTQYQSGRLEPQGKDPASHFYFGLKGENWGLSRFSTRFVICEEDLVSSVSVDLASVATKEVARAAARTLPDLCYALLLSNPKMVADGLPLFDAGHSNYATGSGSALQASGVDAPDVLDTALAAIGKQVMTDNSGLPIHIGLAPKVLICAPGAYGPGRRFARRLRLQDGADLEVRMESRLSSLGTVDPQTGVLFCGGDGAWLLASPGKLAASLVVGGLQGQGVEPVIRTWALGGPGEYAGMWGVGVDVKLDLAAVAVDWKSLYFSAGQ